ncbi:hypothetical protein [Pseudidiomarina insulisalsae]|uniref:Tetratricopeptide repeat protein n=1 Tax=Pseudidiomarina insulisalsae TaxID=575789 RepID=A0A432Y8U5_9GAMM|nr:hypothetical protein [Pseudidiomarina insulisalsae]RUO57342.1 hypothetical protein CWI71_11855 [Pseudidiomarina insulisalsae]
MSKLRVIAMTLSTLFLGACQSTPVVISEPVQQSEREVAMQAYSRGDYHTAEGILQRLAAAPVFDTQAICYLGAIHYRQHEYQAALQRFTECSQHYPEQSEVWFNAAATHLRLATELLLIGRSYQNEALQRSARGQHYQEFLQVLLDLQRHNQVSGAN